MKAIYMSHPVRGNVEENLRRARTWLKWITEIYPDIVVCANWILECELWDDSNPNHRAAGLARDIAMITRCDELWLVGPCVSSGMELERDHAMKMNKKIVDFTKYGGIFPPAVDVMI